MRYPTVDPLNKLNESETSSEHSWLLSHTKSPLSPLPKKLYGFASASKPFLVEKHAANLENTCNWDSKDSYLNENKLEEWRWSYLPWPQCALEMQEGALKSYIDYTEEGKFL